VILFPPWEYIEDFVSGNGWTKEDLAARMGGDIADNLCRLDFLSTCDPRIRIDEDTAKKLAHAFGTSHELWMNLCESFRRASEAIKQAQATPAASTGGET
jgi:plasmid maintenance system antidote protein VapI